MHRINTMRNCKKPISRTGKRIFVVHFLILFMMSVAMCSCLGGNRHAADKNNKENGLLINGRPLGQPLSHDHTEIRMVRVESYEEALRIIRRISADSPPLSDMDNTLQPLAGDERRCPGESYHCTTHTDPRTHEVAILYVPRKVAEQTGIHEIHFVETIKIN